MQRSKGAGGQVATLHTGKPQYWRGKRKGHAYSWQYVCECKG